MSLQAKFLCKNTTQSAWTKGEPQSETVELEPVCDPANKEWCEATPSGSLKMVISNKGAFGTLKPGTEYLITIQEFPASA